MTLSAHRGDQFRRATAVLLGSFAAQGLGALAGLLLARWLSVDDYGYYTILTSVMGVMAVLTMGGVHMGLTAMLSRTWPDLQRAREAVEAALRVRARLSLIMLPPVLGGALVLLLMNGANLATALFLVLMLLLIWAGEFRTRLLDQLLFFDNKASRVQALDTGLAALRLTGVLGLHALGYLNIFWAIGLIATLALAKVPVIYAWVRTLLRSTSCGFIGTNEREIADAVRRQLPVEFYYVAQSQILVLVLTTFGTVADIAGLGAVTRIHQLLLPIEGFVYAFCVPIFASARSGIVPKYLLLVLVTSIPGVALTILALLQPWTLLWLVGPNYAGLEQEIVVAAAVGMVLRASLTAWQLLAHRGWLTFSWLQILFGLASLAMIAIMVDLGTITGALLLTLSLAVGRLAAVGAEWVSAHRRHVLG